MASFEEFRKDFLEDVFATEENEENGTVASFVKVCATKLFEADVLPEYSPCYYQGYGYRNAALNVDGFAYDESDGTFYLLVAKFSGADEPQVLIGSEAKSLLDRCRAFANQSIENNLASKIEISTEAYDLAALINDQVQDIKKFVIILLTDMTLSERALLSEMSKTTSRKKKKSKRTGVLDAENIADIDVEYRIWDLPRFFRIFSTGDGHEEIIINFKDYIDTGIPCLPANNVVKNEICSSYICTIPGDVLADLYDEYGSRLLEGNVRSFLGRRGVNKDIRNTVLNEPEMFFVYNNGLAATATEVVVERDKLISVRDLQIVNGGQTTATLSATRHSNAVELKDISVLMKLTQVNAEKAGEIVPIISKSANSQNRIRPADFFSTHEYHIRMEQMSRREYAPAKYGEQYETHWFYERARGQYIQATIHMTSAQERKFKIQNPKNQVITKTDLAKVLNAWDELPHLVSKGAESNFGEFAKRIDSIWEKKKDDFNVKYFHDAVALTIIYRSLDKAIPKQDWYEGGYKANIVAYSVSYLHYLIHQNFKEKELDLNKIWKEQSCSETLSQQLLTIAEKVYYGITSSDRIVQNVTQWCKQPLCWDSIKKMDVSIVEGFEENLIDIGDLQEKEKEAREVRKIDNTIDAQKEVLDLGENYWEQLQIWIKTHPLASPSELSALKVTAFSQGLFPNEKQCANLLKLRERAVSEGFPKQIQ